MSLREYIFSLRSRFVVGDAVCLTVDGIVYIVKHQDEFQILSSHNPSMKMVLFSERVQP